MELESKQSAPDVASKTNSNQPVETGGSIGGVYLFPTEAKGVIVQYYPRLVFSCEIPATKRKIKVSYYKREDSKHTAVVNTPKLLLSQIIYQNRPYCGDWSPCACSSCYPSVHPIVCYCEDCLISRGRINLHNSVFFLYSLRKDEHFINAAPYRLANVYETGKVCNGRQKIALSLRQLHFNFWSSAFNNDFSMYEPYHIACNKLHSYSRYHFTKPHTNANSYSRNRCCRQIEHPCDCIKTTKSGSHTVTCACYKGCNCKCKCVCCLGDCLCICSCECCRNVCSCVCRCDLNIDFIEMLKAYRPEDEDFSDITADICGVNYLSSGDSADGVFLSYKRSLLDSVNKEHHRITKSGPAIVGMARFYGSICKIDLGKETLTLKKSELYLL